MEPLLTAIWQAEFQRRYGHYRTALVLLADVALELGMTKWCRRVVEEVLPQVRGGASVQLRDVVLTVACVGLVGRSSAGMISSSGR